MNQSRDEFDNSKSEGGNNRGFLGHAENESAFVHVNESRTERFSIGDFNLPETPGMARFRRVSRIARRLSRLAGPLFNIKQRME